MIGLRRALWALAALGAALIALELLIVLRSDHLGDPLDDALIIAIPMATWIGVGLYAWARRPANRVGLLMTATGFAGFFNAFIASDDPVVFGLGIALGSSYAAIAIHMLLAFPTGRLRTRLDRRLAAAAYVLALGAQVLHVLFARECDCDMPAPENGLVVFDLPDVAEAIRGVSAILAAFAVLVTAFVLVGRWRRSPGRERRVLAPVLLTGAAMVVLLGTMVAVQAAGAEDAAQALSFVGLLTFSALPFAFLAGLGRSRAWRAGAVTELLDTLGTAPVRGNLRDALADALDDPTLEIAYWLPERGRHVDAAGAPVRLPDPGDERRAATEVEREGRRIGALVHDRRLADDPELLRATASAAALALANERLDAELRARVAELSRSREFLVETSLAERRRLERDLHDGAQQRLVSLSLQLGLVDKQLERGDAEAARRLLEATREEARLALDDLRELARGIHPAVLTDRGLGAALEALAERAPLPVEIDAVPDRPLPGTVEAAAYFVVSESLANVAKYARASHASVRVGTRNGHALVEVRDDGVGGADPARGTGLRGLEERLAALDGRLEIESEPGRGTLVRARVPCRT